MTRGVTRWVGTGLTAGTVLALLLAYALVGATPVGASECCQVCEVKQAACYAACEGMSHEEGDTDSLDACYTACDDNLYDSVNGCWTHCTNCGQPPSPSQCYSYTIQHVWYCAQCSPPCTLCWQWVAIHPMWVQQTGNEWCMP
jgi:hypothetical protein